MAATQKAQEKKAAREAAAALRQQEAAAQTEQGTAPELPAAPAPAKAAKPAAPAAEVKPNYNTEYAEYKVKVQPHMRRQSGGGNEVYKYTGKKTELVRDNIRIEAFRAEALNAKWYSRGHIFIAKGDDTETFEHIVNPDLD